LSKPTPDSPIDPLEESRARLAAIVAGADDAIVSKTLEGIITSWNAGAERMFGYTAEEAIGHSIAIIIPPDRLHEETEILARLQRGEKTEHFETERIHKSGRVVAVSVNVSPVRDSRGRVIGASKVARDMTEQRAAQAKLAASVYSLAVLYRLVDQVGQARTRDDVCNAAVDSIVHAFHIDRASVLLFDEQGVMRFVCWRGLSDTYRQKMEGHSPWTADADDPQPIFIEDVAADPSMAPLREAILAEGIRALAFIPLLFQGRLLGKFMVYFPEVRAMNTDERLLAETIGRHVGFGLARMGAEEAATHALAGERAARAEADKALAEAEQASKAKDEFLAMLAHELRNPLGVIVHATRVLTAKKMVTPEGASPLAMVERQSAHLARLLDDLLDVSRIRSGHIELRAEPVDLREVVGLAIDAQRVRIVEKEQKLAVSLPEREAMVIGDPVRLQQVVGNLVHNASKYTPRGGSIFVSLVATADERILTVRDDGEGIPAERLSTIFDLFFQGDPTLARTEGGLGIGLTLVKRVVELHQGTVVARSPGRGLGSTLEVRLPAHASLGKPAAPVGPPPSAGRRRILVVEDHDDGREALVTLLRLQGHEVEEAARGRDAVDRAVAGRPDAVLLDIGLPDLDGYAVARELRAKLGDQVRLIALTGYGQPLDRERARDAGFDAHLVKPADLEQIAAAL
jgi:PAS domain S-box-containing protein